MAASNPPRQTFLHHRHPGVPHPDTLGATHPEFSDAMVQAMAGVLGSKKFIWFCIILDLFGLAGLVYQIYVTIKSGASLAVLALEVSLLVSVFLAQAVIQLIALPVLQNYQNRQSAADDAKKAADHQALTYIATGQDGLADALNPDTPGGLAAVLALLVEIKAMVEGKPA